jgi:chemotaxis protein MotA
MNLGTLIGIISSLVVFSVAVVFTLTNSSVLIDFHAILIVVGGTLAASLICFPMDQMVKLFKVFFKRVLGTNKKDYNQIINDIGILSKAWRRSKSDFEGALAAIRDPFLRDAGRALFWLEGDISEAELRDLLDTMIATHYDEYMDEAKIFRTLGRFPPAFGLMGTTLGLIALFQALGGSDGASAIGPGMAVALCATLYGLFLANFVFIPIAENLEKQTHEDMVARKMIAESVMLIQAKKPTKYVIEKAKSFLLPSKRPGGTGPETIHLDRAS